MAKGGYVYIITNYSKTVLYTGVTSDLSNRIYQHRCGEGSTFTKKYNCKYLVYYEFFKDIKSAIHREKRIKKYKREWKENLIDNLNPDWEDLYNEIEDMK